ncbi:MAG: hypothetical protein ABSG53_10415 [Thermoguttaceae bacterium]
MPYRAARILETGSSVVAGVAAVRWTAAQWGLRRFERGSLARKLPHLRSFGWMTYRLGQGWTSAPPGLFPALESRAPDWGFPGFVFYGAPGFIHNDHFLSCSERVRGFTAPALGALGHSTDFSMPVYAADF